ncbi:hypothetical protein OSTOST_09798 [Ostertagia ostertagi]
MNCGSDSSVEFYASNRQSSLYERKVSKDSRTYTPEGRVLINGMPETQESPDDMWRSLICKAITTRVMKDVEPQQSGPLAVIRRFSSRLGYRNPRRYEKETEKNEGSRETNEDGENGESGKDGENGEDVKKKEKHVTIIRVKTMRRKDSEDDKEHNGDESDEVCLLLKRNAISKLANSKYSS